MIGAKKRDRSVMEEAVRSKDECSFGRRRPARHLLQISTLPSNCRRSTEGLFSAVARG
jgi:hypothetical protein